MAPPSGVCLPRKTSSPLNTPATQQCGHAQGDCGRAGPHPGQASVVRAGRGLLGGVAAWRGRGGSGLVWSYSLAPARKRAQLHEHSRAGAWRGGTVRAARSAAGWDGCSLQRERPTSSRLRSSPGAQAAVGGGPGLWVAAGGGRGGRRPRQGAGRWRGAPRCRGRPPPAHCWARAHSTVAPCSPTQTGLLTALSPARRWPALLLHPQGISRYWEHAGDAETEEAVERYLRAPEEDRASPHLGAAMTAAVLGTIAYRRPRAAALFCGAVALMSAPYLGFMASGLGCGWGSVGGPSLLLPARRSCGFDGHAPPPSRAHQARLCNPHHTTTTTVCPGGHRQPLFALRHKAGEHRGDHGRRGRPGPARLRARLGRRRQRLERLIELRLPACPGAPALLAQHSRLLPCTPMYIPCVRPEPGIAAASLSSVTAVRKCSQTGCGRGRGRGGSQDRREA